jgi:hypothetical protein
MPTTIERPTGEALLTDTQWQGKDEEPTVTTCTYWWSGADEPFLIQEFRPADREEDLSLEEAAEQQRQFLESISDLEFVD